jgi:hypothetical protein
VKLMAGVVAVAVAVALALAVAAAPLALAVAALAVPGAVVVGPLGAGNPPVSGGDPAGGGAAAGRATVGNPPVATGQLVADIPPAMLALYVVSAPRCPGLPWTVLAAIGKIETDHGRGAEVSPAGAEGPMQFLPTTWAAFGVDGNGDGLASIWDPADAVAAAADYLCANGAGDPRHLATAIWNYNHDDAYVRLVLAWAATYTAAALVMQ